VGGGTQAPVEGEVISALFDDTSRAEEAVRALLAAEVPPKNISMIIRDEDHKLGTETGGVGGVAREVLGEEGLTYRATPELPNYEDLPSTDAQVMGDDPVVAAAEGTSRSEPYGGDARMGLSRDEDLVRRMDAHTAADEDIYTDFPDKPGGINPESPAAPAADADVMESKEKRNEAPGNAAVGAGIGGFVGLLAGAAALAVPGIGPFIAAGPLAAVLGGALAGTAAGGVIGALSGIGVPEEYAREYAAAIEQGQTLVSVQAGGTARATVEQILTEHGGSSVH
jgi:hypothetical protein